MGRASGSSLVFALKDHVCSYGGIVVFVGSSGYLKLSVVCFCNLTLSQGCSALFRDKAWMKDAFPFASIAVCHLLASYVMDL